MVPTEGEKFAIADGEDLGSHHYPNIKEILKDRAVQPTYFGYCSPASRAHCQGRTALRQQGQESQVSGAWVRASSSDPPPAAWGPPTSHL